MGHLKNITHKIQRSFNVKYYEHFVKQYYMSFTHTEFIYRVNGTCILSNVIK